VVRAIYAASEKEWRQFCKLTPSFFADLVACKRCSVTDALRCGSRPNATKARKVLKHSPGLLTKGDAYEDQAQMRRQRDLTLVARFCCCYLRNHLSDSEMTSLPPQWGQKVSDQLHAIILPPGLPWSRGWQGHIFPASSVSASFCRRRHGRSQPRPEGARPPLPGAAIGSRT
jgi:hypothetical protein